MSVLERRRRMRRAGRSAREKYAAETRAWRRRNRRVFATVTGGAAAIVAVSLVLGSRSITAWIAGVAAGAAVAFVVALRESPPSWIENYQRGAWGEERTAKALEPVVRRGWVVLHDLRWDKGNFDHVLVGPAGIFAVDSKNWVDEARFSGGRLWTKSPSASHGTAQDSMARAARGQARQLHDWLEQRGAGRWWVDAVIVLWMDFDQGEARGAKIAFVHGERLASWLAEQPPKLNPRQVQDIAAHLSPGRRRAASGREFAAT